MRNNLLNFSTGSLHYRVKHPFKVYVKVGFTESNTYFGGSMVYANVWEHRTLPVGTEIHALYGGTFVTCDGNVFEAQYTIDRKHPFEKDYFPRTEQWPLENLMGISLDETTFRGRYWDADTPKVTPPAKATMAGIDYVIEKE